MNKKVLYLPSFLVLLVPTVGAVTTSVSTDEPTSSDFFSDGGGDYFGVVENSNQIEGANFSASVTSPLSGYLAGRDHDDASSRPEEVHATWELTLPGDAGVGTGFTNIMFSANVAASENGWDNAGDLDFIEFNLYLNGSSSATKTLTFVPNGLTTGLQLRLDTNGDGVGDGLALVAGGTAISMVDAGGASVNSISLVGTYKSDSGGAEHWTFGTLSADYDMVPEPSSCTFLGLAAAGLLLRRSRK